MHTIRGRLVFWYAVALGATMFVFALTVYLAQRSENLAELDARARVEADLAAQILQVAQREPEGVASPDPKTGRRTLAARVATRLAVIPDFVAVLGAQNETLYLSTDASALSGGSLVRLLERATAQPRGEGFGSVKLDLPVGDVRFFVRPIARSDPSLGMVLSGASTSGVVLGPQRLLSVMLVIAPFILVASVLIGYLLVGSTLKPVENIVDEVEAISDGRSLHRRLVEPKTGDELARLSATLNAMLARLERSFISLRRFTADASHELKTPLTVLRSGVERAITHPATPPVILEVLEETLIEVNRMTEMVDSLLMLARADEGRAPLHLEQLDMGEILSEISETASILGEQAGVAVEVSGPSRPLILAADPSRIRQLVMNLLTNATKYTPKGGNVWVEAHLDGGQVKLTVRDTGIGIAPGDLPHVFDRFWRADAARSRTGQRPGAGLGLAICKWIAEAHGGSIEAVSRPGRGTTFTVTLPAGTDARPAEEAEKALQDADPSVISS
jgi:heavy metal sensor kinase